MLDVGSQFGSFRLDGEQPGLVAFFRLMSYNSRLSASSRVRCVSVTTTPSSAFFSLPSSCARLGSFQTVGSSSQALTVLSLSDLASKSKIPP